MHNRSINVVIITSKILNIRIMHNFLILFYNNIINISNRTRRDNFINKHAKSESCNEAKIRIENLEWEKTNQ
jgi:hypothetical protein